MNIIYQFIVNFVGITNLIIMYQIYLNIYNFFIKIWNYITIIIIGINCKKTGIYEIIFVKNKNNSIQILPHSLNIQDINKSINYNDSGYLDIKYASNNHIYNMIVPWNINLNELNDNYVQIISNKLIKINLLKPVPIIYAVDKYGNDYTELIQKYSGHLSNYTQCPTKSTNNLIILTDIHLKYIRPILLNNEIEILTENGDTFII